MRSKLTSKILASTPLETKEKVARYGNRKMNNTFVVSITPLVVGDLPRLAFVTSSSTIGGLITYKIKSLAGCAEMWKHDFDNLINSGEYKLITK